MRALLIAGQYVDKILAGTKTWEIRGSRTNVREKICLVRSGSREIAGVCDLTDCIGPLTREQFRANARKAGLNESEARLGYYKKTFAWVLSNPRELKKAIPYKHPIGAVIWVKLDDRTVRAVLTSCPES
jgi:hypothetical protein